MGKASDVFVMELQTLCEEYEAELFSTADDDGVHAFVDGEDVRVGNGRYVKQIDALDYFIDFPGVSSWICGEDHDEWDSVKDLSGQVNYRGEVFFINSLKSTPKAVEITKISQGPAPAWKLADVPLKEPGQCRFSYLEQLRTDNERYRQAKQAVAKYLKKRAKEPSVARLMNYNCFLQPRQEEQQDT